MDSKNATHLQFVSRDDSQNISPFFESHLWNFAHLRTRATVANNKLLPIKNRMNYFFNGVDAMSYAIWLRRVNTENRSRCDRMSTSMEYETEFKYVDQLDIRTWPEIYIIRYKFLKLSPRIWYIVVAKFRWRR